MAITGGSGDDLAMDGKRLAVYLDAINHALNT
mgnify:CR=1 FL=1